MTETQNPTQPPAQPHDICLLLRAHGEQLWLTSEVLPVLRELELPGAIPEDQLGAALAYLEVLWLQASMRAAETDATYAKLEPAAAAASRILHDRARRYHAAVSRLRVSIGQRVSALTRSCQQALACEQTGA
jgi:hypothetical protein